MTARRGGYRAGVSRVARARPDLRGLWGELEDVLARGAEEARVWLSTPTGRQVRSIASKLLIVSVPLALRHPFFKTPLGRVVELTGGAALLIKLAEMLRDWEPEPGR